MNTVKDAVIISADQKNLLLEMYRRERAHLPPLGVNQVSSARLLMEDKLITCRVWEKTEPHYIGCHLTDKGRLLVEYERLKED